MQDILLATASNSTNTEKIKTLIEALKQAEKQSNAYNNEIIRITKSELERQIGVKTSDVNSQISDLTTAINRLKEDLVYGSGDLSVEEQAELKRQQRNYEIQLESLTENVAAAGLTFSSRRALAEQRLADENTDVVESTQRKYAREMRDLRLRAARGEEDALKKITDLNRGLGEGTTSLIRTAEEKIGTDNLPNTTGAVGGVLGELEQNKWSDISARAKSLTDLTNF
jgi:hypothetical protein